MPPTVGSFYGPMLVGAFFNVLFHGVFVLQAFNYWQTYKRDSLWLKALVLYLFVAETANSVATIFIVYQPLVLQNGTKLPLTILPTMLAGDPIITALISTPVQIFIAYRMKVLSKSWILPAIVTLIALASLGGSLWLGGILIGIKHFPHNGEHETPFKVWLATSAAADIFITAGLTWSLQGSKAGLSGTDSVPKKIVRLIIQTGLLTSVLALLDIVLFCKVPTSTVNFTLDFMIAKLYGITLLSTLNARVTLKDVANNHPIQSNILFGTEIDTLPTTVGAESTLKGEMLPSSRHNIDVPMSKPTY